ncbi:MAG: WG repeat-containing protein, partial [Bacteroidota bacterium]
MKFSEIIALCFIIIPGRLLFSQSVEEGEQYLDSLINASISEEHHIDSIQSFDNGFQKVVSWVYYECNGDLCPYPAVGLITPKADSIAPILLDVVLLKNGNVLINNSKSLILDSEMKVISYYKSVSQYTRNLAVAQGDLGYGLINMNGEEVLQLNYDYVQVPDKWGRIVTKKEKKWEVIHRDNFLTETESRDDFLSFYDSVSSAPKVVEIIDPETNKIGLLGQEGTMVQPYKYDEVDYLFNGNIVARKKGFWGMLDSHGQEISQFKYREINDTGYAVVIISGGDEFDPSYGLLNYEGKEVAPMEYNRIS